MLGLIGRRLLDDPEGIRDMNTIPTEESPSKRSQPLQRSWVVLQPVRAVRFPKQAQVAIKGAYLKSTTVTHHQASATIVHLNILEC
jgi:hypothetical protein